VEAYCRSFPDIELEGMMEPPEMSVGVSGDLAEARDELLSDTIKRVRGGGACCSTVGSGTVLQAGWSPV
jgi:hypothetical protein